MATLVVGYDVEAFAIGEGLARIGDHGLYTALEPESTIKGLEIITRNHEEFDAPATLFVCGRTLVHEALPAIKAASVNPLFDIQQHTYSHILFKEDRWKGGVFRPSTPEAIAFEVEATSGLLRKHLGVEVTGLRTPHGYYQGLADRPESLKILHDNGIRFVSSWGRNERNEQPTPWSAQPYWYVKQGFPDMLEIPFQFWLDGTWFEAFGPKKGVEFGQLLRGALDEVVEKDLVYGSCFHDWCMVHYNESGTGWVRTLLQHARERNVEILSYTQFYEREVSRKPASVASA